MTQLIGRHEAHANGQTRFFTGKACRYGHVSERWVSTGACIACTYLPKKMANSAWNLVFPPSKLAFPGDMEQGWLTPELISGVWAEILKLAPAIIDQELQKRGHVRPTRRREIFAPRVSRQAEIEGYRDYAHLLTDVPPGKSPSQIDHTLYASGYLIPPLLRDGSPDWLEWLADGGTHWQAVDTGMIVGWPQ